MKLHFHKIEIKNFLAVGNVPVTFEFNAGLHAIVGKVIGQSTSNGVGKSTICEALVWGIYGNTLRKLNKDKIINSINESDCYVTIWLSVNNKEYIIERGIKPDVVKLTDVANPSIEERSSKKEDQSKISKLIEISFETFKNIIAININYSVPFFRMNISEKRSLFEDINNLSLYGKMLDVVRKEYNENKTLLKIVSAELTILNNSHNQLEKIYNNVQDLKLNWETQKNNKIKDITTDLDNHKLKLETLIKSQKNINIKENIDKGNRIRDSLQASLSEISASIRLNNVQLESLPKKLLSLKSNPVCSLCNSPTDGDHIKQHISELETSISTLKQENFELTEKYNNTKDKKEKILEKLEVLRVHNNNQIRIETDITNVSKRIQELEADLLFNTNKTIDIKESITKEQLDKSFQVVNAKLKETIALEISLKYSDYMKGIFGDDGIKTWVIKKIIPILNKKLNEYLSIFGANYNVTFNSDLEETFKSKRGEDFTYNNFSSGEQKRIAMAFMFAIISIAKAQSSVDCNVLFLDEVCDSSMYSDGIYALMNFLKTDFQRTYPSLASLHIELTHKKEISEDNFNSIIHLKKKNGFTKIDNIQLCQQVIQT